MTAKRWICVRRIGCMVLLGAAVASAAERPAGLVPYRIDGDAIIEPLAGEGDVARGREVVLGRDGNCVLCHAVPNVSKRYMGDLAPSLAGVGSRLDAGQIRLRIVDSTKVNEETIMPPYYRVEGLHSVAESWRGKPVLDAQQVEDVVAFLRTLR